MSDGLNYKPGEIFRSPDELNDEELYLHALANHLTEADYPSGFYVNSQWDAMWHEAMRIKPPPFVQDGKVQHPTAYSSVRVIEGRVIAELGWCYGQQPLGFAVTPEVTGLCLMERAKQAYTLEEAKAQAADRYIKSENAKIAIEAIEKCADMAVSMSQPVVPA